MEKPKKPRGRPKVKNPETERINLRVTPERKQRYEKAADRHDKSLSRWMKDLADNAS